MFDVLKNEGIDIPVIHHICFAAGTLKDEIVIKTGSWLGDGGELGGAASGLPTLLKRGGRGGREWHLAFLVLSPVVLKKLVFCHISACHISACSPARLASQDVARCALYGSCTQ